MPVLKLLRLKVKPKQALYFLHKSDYDTKVQFPFDYELRVIYTLDDKALEIDYSVKKSSLSINTYICFCAVLFPLVRRACGSRFP